MATSDGEPRASVSTDFPESFFDSAPLRRSGELSVAAAQRFHRLRTASLALSRVVALGTAVPWLVFMALGRLSSGGYGPAWQVVWGLFITASIAVIIAAVLHRERFYFFSFLGAGGSYCIVLAVHVGFVLLTGQSPLAGMYLGDYVGLPAAMLVTALPVRVATPVAVVIIAVAATFNLGTPPGLSLILEIAHAELLMLPFLLLLQAGRSASRLLDEMATRAHRLAVRVARTKALAELETRFLAHLHDRVLTYLAGLRRGVITPEDTAARDAALEPRVTEPAALVSLAGVVADLVDDVAREAPDIRVTVPGAVPEVTTIPADAAAVLHDAAVEAVVNTRRHAPGAPAFLDVAVNLSGTRCTGVTVTVRDEGPGFDPAAIPADRAGIRVALAGRMQATDGCGLLLDTAPGDGTTVALSWAPDGPRADGETVDEVSVPGVYELLGVGRIFRPRNAVIAWLVFLGLGLNNQHGQPLFWTLSLAAAGLALAALTTGRVLRLPGRASAVTALAILVFFLAAILDFSVPAETWPHAWFTRVFILLCTYLALRDRAVTVALTWAACLILAEVLTAFGLNTPATGAAVLAPMSIVLIPAVLIPRMVKLTTRGLPLALELGRNRATATETVATQTSFIEDSAGWVRQLVFAALHPALPQPVRRANGELLELRLRDSIRSPNFDSARVNRAVWDARARGTRVRLLDDGGGHEPGAAAEELRDTLIRVLEQDRGNAPTQQVTARILPPGRGRYGTVVISAGEQVERIEVG